MEIEAVPSGSELVLNVAPGAESDLFGVGVYVTKEGLKGWYGGGVAVRREEQARLWTHGQFSLPGTRDARVVTVTGVAWGTSRRAAGELVDLLNSVMADGNVGRLVVNDPDVGMRWANCYLTGTPEVDWDYDDTLTWTLDFVCPNPRKYGPAVEYNTGISELGGGLTFPLFAGTPHTLAQTNPVPNPNATVSLNTTGYTGTAAALSQIAAANPAGARTFRATISSTTAGDMVQRVELTSRLPVTANKEYTASAYVRTVSTSFTQLRLMFYNAGGTLLTTDSSTNLSPNSGFQRQTVSAVAPSSAATAQLRLGLPTASPRAASAVFDWNGLQLDQAGAVRNYVDGSLPATGTDLYEWAGTPGNSESRRLSIDGADGVLDFGVPGRLGTVTFTNQGKADTYPEFWVRGYTPYFMITELETGRQLEYVGEVPQFQTLFLNAANGAVYLNSTEANRLDGLGRDEWPVIPGGATRTYLFDSPEGPNARLFFKAASAWF